MSFDQPNRNTISRRHALCLAGSALAPVSLSSLVAAKEQRPWSVDAIGGLSGRLWRRHCLADDSVQSLIADLQAQGWRHRPVDTIVHRTRRENESTYRTVVLPFTRHHSGEEAAIVWSETNIFPPQSRQFRSRGHERYQLRSSMVDAGSVVSETSSLELYLWGRICRDINWSCVLSIAGALAGTVAACGACLADLSRLTCLSCVGAASSTAGTVIGCSWCNA